MSTPSNPLANYHTYAYHHILMVSNTTALISAFERQQISLSNLTSPSFSQENSVVTPIQLSYGKGSYIVLINGTSDAEFIIDDIKWSTIVSQTQSGVNYSLANSLTEGSMVVLEPKGFRFLNAIKRSLDALQVHPSAAVFVLKTIFIGYKDNGEVELINNIKPFSFSILDITGQFDEAGSTYDISFVGTSNGVTKLPQYVNAGASVSSIKAGRTLLDTIIRYQDALEGEYFDYVWDIEESLNLDKESVNAQAISDFYRLVKYRIELDPLYWDSSYKIDQLPETTQEKGGDNDPGNIISFGSKTTIENALYKIMNLCGKVFRDAKGDNPEKQTRLFKIHSTIREDTNASDDIDLVVVYKIYPFEVPTVPQSEASKGTIRNVNPEDVLEFDYLYTGKNTDILNMDLKMQMGLQFFYTMASSSNMSTATGVSKFQVPDSSAQVPGSVPQSHNERRALTPLFFPSSSRETSTQHINSPAEKLNFEALLRRHAALESLETKITIHGNPYILNDLILTPNEFNTSERDGLTAFRNWQRRPAFIKINIKMPNTNDDEFVSVPFWYDGYYIPIEIANEFTQGEFKQTIDMISLPIRQDTPDSKGVETKDKTKSLQQVERTYIQGRKYKTAEFDPDNFNPLLGP